jgi:hypothetical protein
MAFLKGLAGLTKLKDENASVETAKGQKRLHWAMHVILI